MSFQGVAIGICLAFSFTTDKDKISSVLWFLMVFVIHFAAKYW